MLLKEGILEQVAVQKSRMVSNSTIPKQENEYLYKGKEKLIRGRQGQLHASVTH